LNSFGLGNKERFHYKIIGGDKKGVKKNLFGLAVSNFE